MANQQHRECVRDALKCDRLKDQLYNVICVDDDCEPDDYSDWQLVSEATYMRSLYFEGGTVSNMEYRGDEGEDIQRAAKREVRQLNRFIKKWTPTLDKTPNCTGCGKPELKQ